MFSRLSSKRTQARNSAPRAVKRTSSAPSRHNLFEPLETRQLLAASAGLVNSNHVLRVEGTTNPDNILVEMVNKARPKTTKRVPHFHVRIADKLGRVAVDRFFDAAGINQLDVFAGDGADLVNTRTTKVRNVVHLGSGDDFATTGSGSDVISGEAGNDNIDGRTGNDRLFGNQGIDRLAGVSGEDVLSGGTDNDQLNVLFNFASYIQNRGRSIAPSNEYDGGANGTDTLNLKLDMGRFIGKAVLPAVAQVQKITRNLQPLVDFYDREVPFIKEIVQTFAGAEVDPRLGDATFGDVLDQDGSLRTVVNLIKDVNRLDINAQGGTIGLGSYRVSSQGVELVGEFTPSATFTQLNETLGQAGFSLPALVDADTWGRMTLGQDVSLFTWTLPSTSVHFESPDLKVTVPVTIPGAPIPPIPVEIGVKMDATLEAHGTIGMDTTGLRNGDMMSSFFVTDDTGASVTMHVNPFVKPNLGIDLGPIHVNIASATIAGSIGGTVGISLTDPSGNDHRVHLSEMGQNPNPFKLSPSISYAVSIAAETSVGNFGPLELARGSFNL
jgi:hypothetical protein